MWTLTPPKADGFYWYMESKIVYAPHVTELYMGNFEHDFLDHVLWWDEPITPPPHRPSEGEK